MIREGDVLTLFGDVLT